VLSYAESHQCVVFTHDLDFSAILAATKSSRPSVVQVRAQDTLSDPFRGLFVAVRIDVYADPTVSYASYQNHVPLARGLSITNGGRGGAAAEALDLKSATAIDGSSE
jgi:hypothetical protein